MKPASAKRYTHSNSAEDYLLQRIEFNDEDCWNFTGALDKDGYGQVHHSKIAKQLNVTRAHQLAYVWKFGPIPTGMFVCHHCDNPSCVNPEHLFLGTPNDNVQDMMRKGRYIVYNRPRKLSSEDRQIILNSKGTVSCMELAKQFNISFSRVCQIWRENENVVC